MSFQEMMQAYRKAIYATNERITIMLYTSLVMSAITTYSIVEITYTTHPVSRRFAILYVILFFQLLFWFCMLSDKINLQAENAAQDYSHTFEYIVLDLKWFRIMPTWLFCCEYFVGMTQVLPVIKRKCFFLTKSKKLKLPINILVFMFYLICIGIYQYYFLKELDTKIIDDPYWKNKKQELMLFLNNMNCVFTFGAIFMLVCALLMVYFDFRERNAMIKDPFMNPIHFNLPNFVIHSLILTVLFSINIYQIPITQKEYKNDWDTQPCYPGDYSECIKPMQEYLKTVYCTEAVMFSQVVADLIVQFIFWRITSMSCQRLERSYENKVTDDENLDEVIHQEIAAGLLKTTSDADDMKLFQEDEQECQDDVRSSELTQEEKQESAFEVEETDEISYLLAQQFFTQSLIRVSQKIEQDIAHDQEKSSDIADITPQGTNLRPTEMLHYVCDNKQRDVAPQGVSSDECKSSQEFGQVDNDLDNLESQEPLMVSDWCRMRDYEETSNYQESFLKNSWTETK